MNVRQWQCDLGPEDVLAVLIKPSQVIENASDFKKEQSTIECPIEVSTSKLNEQKVTDLWIDIDKAKEECFINTSELGLLRVRSTTGSIAAQKLVIHQPFIYVTSA